MTTPRKKSTLRKQSKKTNKTNKKSTMTYFAKNVLDKYKNNTKHFNIQRIYKGKAAIKKAINLFYPENNDQGTKWISQWTSKEQKQAIFFIVSRKLKSNTQFYYKFVIGDSILGEKY